MRPTLFAAPLLAALLGAAACTATEQSSEAAQPRALPAEVRTDADRRAIYDANGTAGPTAAPVPDATPNRMRLGEQAADINRRKRPESLNTNDPNLTTPETRLRRLDADAPADTLRRP